MPFAVARDPAFEDMATRVEGWMFVSVDEGKVGRTAWIHPPMVDQWRDGWIRRYCILDPVTRSFFLQDKARVDTHIAPSASAAAAAAAAGGSMHASTAVPSPRIPLMPLIETGVLPGPRRKTGPARTDCFFPNPDPEYTSYTTPVPTPRRLRQVRQASPITPPDHVPVDGVTVRTVHPSVFEGHEEFTHVFQVIIPSAEDPKSRLLCRCVHAQEMKVWLKGFNEIAHSKGFYKMYQLNLQILKASGYVTKNATLTQVCFGPFLNAQTSSAEGKKASSIIWKESFSFSHLSPSENTVTFRLMAAKKDQYNELISEGTFAMGESEDKREATQELGNKAQLALLYSYSVLNVFPLRTYDRILGWFEACGEEAFSRLDFPTFNAPALDLSFYRAFAGVFLERHGLDSAECWLERWMKANLLEEWFKMHRLDTENQTCTIRSQAGGNRLLDKMLEGYIMSLGRQYLQDTFVDLIDAVYQDTDAQKINKESKREEIVRRYTEQFWGLLGTSEFPPRLKRFFVDIARAAHKDKIPEELYHFRLRSCLFLRFFCPAILSPHESGITHNVPDTGVQEFLKALVDRLKQQSLAYSELVCSSPGQPNPAGDFCRNVYSDTEGRTERFRGSVDAAPPSNVNVLAAAVVQSLVKHVVRVGEIAAACESAVDKQHVLDLRDALSEVKVLLDGVAAPVMSPPSSASKKQLKHHDSAPSLRAESAPLASVNTFPRLASEPEGSASDSDMAEKSPGTGSPSFPRALSSPAPRRPVPKETSLSGTAFFRSQHHLVTEHSSSQESLAKDAYEELTVKDYEELKLENMELKRQLGHANTQIRDLQSELLALRTQYAAMTASQASSAASTAAAIARRKSIVHSPDSTNSTTL